MHAGEKGHDAIVSRLMDHPMIDLQRVDKAYRLAFQHKLVKNDRLARINPERIFELIENKDENGLIELLCTNPNLANQRNEEGYTPLIFAASEGFSAGVEALLDCHAVSINAIDKDEMSAVMHACQKGHYKIALLLLGQRNINLGLKDKNGKSAFDHALQNNYKAIIDEFVKKSSGEIFIESLL